MSAQESDERGTQIPFIRCSNINLVNPEAPGELQCAFMATESGPIYCSMISITPGGVFRRTKKPARLRSTCPIAKNKTGVRITFDDADRSDMAVLDAAGARALKVAAEGRGTTTTYSTTEPARGPPERICQRRTLCCESAMNPAGETTTESPHGGGCLVVSDVRGRRSVATSSTPLSGFVVGTTRTASPWTPSGP